MRYLLIDEFGNVFKADKITDSDIDGSEWGVLTIIDTESMKQHDGNDFVEIEVWEN